VVLVFLAAVWILVLAPSFLRRRAEHHTGNSIGDFHRQLRILERRGPTLIPPANRLRPDGVSALGDQRVPRLPRATVLALSGDPTPALRPPPARPLSRRSEQRQRTLRRRRQVLATLLGMDLLTLLAGAAPRLHALWLLTALGVVLLAAYVAALVRLRSLAAEREMKVRFLPPAAEPALALRRSVVN